MATGCGVLASFCAGTRSQHQAVTCGTGLDVLVTCIPSTQRVHDLLAMQLTNYL